MHHALKGYQSWSMYQNTLWLIHSSLQSDKNINLELLKMSFPGDMPISIAFNCTYLHNYRNHNRRKFYSSCTKRCDRLAIVFNFTKTWQLLYFADSFDIDRFYMIALGRMELEMDVITVFPYFNHFFCSLYFADDKVIFQTLSFWSSPRFEHC